jgi:hypothetical protein
MVERMPTQQSTLNTEMGPEAAQMMMQPDEEVRIILLSRLESMTPEELQALDRAIDGNIARVLLKLLPELQDLIEISMSRTTAGGQQNGALAGM